MAGKNEYSGSRLGSNGNSGGDPEARKNAE
jgi:hypothetical protein